MLSGLRQGLVRLADAESSGRLRQFLVESYSRIYAPRGAIADGASLWRPLRIGQLPSAECSEFFILGSGASVEDLGSRHFDHIGCQFSVGVNSWPLHYFVPNAYAFEMIRRNPKMARTLSLALDREDVKASRPEIWATRDMVTARSDQRVRVPIELREYQFYYTILSLGTNRKDRLSIAYRDTIRWRDSMWFPDGMLPSVGATIERLAAAAVFAGFANVVFVGVDLNNARYFWQENPEYLEAIGVNGLVSGQCGTVHRTNDPQQKTHPVTTTIEALSEAAMELVGTRFWVASPDSALRRFLPLYQWN